MPDHRVITTFTLVKFRLSFAAFTEVLVSVYTRKMFTWVSKLSYLSKPFKSKHGISGWKLKNPDLCNDRTQRSAIHWANQADWANEVNGLSVSRSLQRSGFDSRSTLIFRYFFNRFGCSFIHTVNIMFTFLSWYFNPYSITVVSDTDTGLFINHAKRFDKCFCLQTRRPIF